MEPVPPKELKKKKQEWKVFFKQRILSDLTTITKEILAKKKKLKKNVHHLSSPARETSILFIVLMGKVNV